jgi:integrase/recombinase XerD
MKSATDINDITCYLQRMGHSKQTIRSYVYGIKNFLNLNPDASGYNFKEVLQYISEKGKDFNCLGTRNTLLAPVKKYYDYLLDIGFRNDHPCRTLYLKIRKRKDIIHQDLFTSAELEMLMEREERYEMLRLKNHALISLLIYQGLAAGEVENIKVDHIDFDKGSLFVRESRKFTRRHLDLYPRQYRIFDRYINEVRKQIIKTETDSLLVGKLGTPITVDDINYLISTFKPLFPERNLNPTTIRQSVISNWLNEKRIPLEQVQLMAGHRWISATTKYLHTPITEQRELINKFHPLK